MHLLFLASLLSLIFKMHAPKYDPHLRDLNNGGDGRNRTYSPEGTDLQSAATLLLSRISINYHFKIH